MRASLIAILLCACATPATSPQERLVVQTHRERAVPECDARDMGEEEELRLAPWQLRGDTQPRLTLEQQVYAVRQRVDPESGFTARQHLLYAQAAQLLGEQQLLLSHVCRATAEHHAEAGEALGERADAAAEEASQWFEIAIGDAANVVLDFPNAPEVEEALFRLIELLAMLREPARAAQVSERLMRSFPNSAWLEIAHTIAGDAWMAAGVLERARETFARVHPASSLGAYAAYRSALAAARMGDVRSAEEDLARARARLERIDMIHHDALARAIERASDH